ncbi:hypothetical protein [Alteromonas halophila]|uniref:Riboflavin biosynthesis protein RibA n=1 Tax=Alteromonas halophila TaxID=516698 RepID=A0A918MZK0_9ALTE|nr:hypothetical protein [Alteromonas halophila]GGW87701.1 hypothetical protein GCM10007391_21780 [Alteromonas halophila]
MSTSPDKLTGHIFSAQHTQLAAVFDSHDEAEATARQLEADCSVSSEQIVIMDPGEAHLSDKLERDAGSIKKKMLNSHLLLGFIGLLAGLILAAILVTVGPALTQQNPVFTFIALISPGFFIGLFAAGLFSLRPDRSALIDTVRHAVKEKRSALIVNLKRSQSVDSVERLLARRGLKVTRSLR